MRHKAYESTLVHHWLCIALGLSSAKKLFHLCKQVSQQKIQVFLICFQFFVDILHHLLRVLATEHIFVAILEFYKEAVA